MNELQNLQEIMALMQEQEKMLMLIETLQAENETLEQKLQECEKELEETKTKLTRSMILNEKLNSENRRLMQQIESWNSLQT